MVIKSPLCHKKDATSEKSLTLFIGTLETGVASWVLGQGCHVGEERPRWIWDLKEGWRGLLGERVTGQGLGWAKGPLLCPHTFVSVAGGFSRRGVPRGLCGLGVRATGVQKSALPPSVCSWEWVCSTVVSVKVDTCETPWLNRAYQLPLLIDYF